MLLKMQIKLKFKRTQFLISIVFLDCAAAKLLNYIFPSNYIIVSEFFSE